MLLNPEALHAVPKLGTNLAPDLHKLHMPNECAGHEIFVQGALFNQITPMLAAVLR